MKQILLRAGLDYNETIFDIANHVRQTALYGGLIDRKGCLYHDALTQVFPEGHMNGAGIYLNRRELYKPFFDVRPHVCD